MLELKRFTISLLLLPCIAIAQLSESQTKYFRQREDSLQSYAIEALKGKSEVSRKAANAHLLELLEHTLHEHSSIDFPFDSLTSIARFEPEDKSFVLYNWELRNDDDTYEYYGFVQRRDKKNKETGISVFTLVDKSANMKRPETASCDHNNWFGVHYYKMVPILYKRKMYYVLLGIDWNDKLTHKKVMEILHFANNGKPKFGDAIIKVGDIKGHPVLQKRYFLEYSSEVTASLRYDERRNIFVFDHLVPQQQNLKGQFQFYGPDLSFDGFEFKKGLFHYIEDVDARNEKNQNDKLYHQPK